MHFVLFILAVLAALPGLAAFFLSTSAIQQAAAGTLLIIGAVLFAGAAIVEAIGRTRREAQQGNERLVGTLDAIDRRLRDLRESLSERAR